MTDPYRKGVVCYSDSYLLRAGKDYLLVIWLVSIFLDLLLVEASDAFHSTVYTKSKGSPVLSSFSAATLLLLATSEGDTLDWDFL